MVVLHAVQQSAVSSAHWPHHLIPASKLLKVQVCLCIHSLIACCLHCCSTRHLRLLLPQLLPALLPLGADCLPCLHTDRASKSDTSFPGLFCQLWVHHCLNMNAGCQQQHGHKQQNCTAGEGNHRVCNVCLSLRSQQGEQSKTDFNVKRVDTSLQRGRTTLTEATRHKAFARAALRASMHATCNNTGMMETFKSAVTHGGGLQPNSAEGSGAAVPVVACCFFQFKKRC